MKNKKPVMGIRHKLESATKLGRSLIYINGRYVLGYWYLYRREFDDVLCIETEGK